MSLRNTETGTVLEQMVLHSLIYGGYLYQSQQYIGSRPGGGKHIIDVIAKGLFVVYQFPKKASPE